MAVEAGGGLTSVAFAEAPAARRAWLGVELAKTVDGVLVKRVVRNSPASRAAIRDGDVIVAVDGVRAADPSEIVGRVARMGVGERLHLRLRAGQRERDADAVFEGAQLAPDRVRSSRCSVPFPSHARICAGRSWSSIFGRRGVTRVGPCRARWPS